MADSVPSRVVTGIRHAAGATVTSGHRILATAAHFSSYYGNSNSRNKPHQTSHNKWKLPVIVVASVLGAIIVAAAAFFLFKRSRQSASYKNLEKPNMGEHRDVFDARISEALETDAAHPLSREQDDGDYAHPYGDANISSRRGSSYGDVDTSYRGPEKTFSEKAHDQGA